MVSRRTLLVAGILTLTVGYVAVGGLGLGFVSPGVEDGSEVPQSKMIQPDDNGSYLWPYTSRNKTVGERTLAVNLVIHGDDDRVRNLLTRQTRLTWQFSSTANTTGNVTNGTVTPQPTRTADGTTENDSGPPGTVTPGETAPQPESVATPNGTNETNTTTETRTFRPGDSILEWSDAHGSTRYSYIDARPNGGEASWIDESYQIHVGDYFGGRRHIRAYTKPKTNWTAVQIHKEYWDWFRLRHTVTDARNSRNVLESGFIDQPYVKRVSREHYGVNGGMNDGWISEIELVPSAGSVLAGIGLVVAGGILTRQTYQSIETEGRRLVGWTYNNVRGFVLAGAVAALYLSVRTLGILLEGVAQSIDPRIYLAVLYPMIAVGVPLTAFLLAQPFGATSRFERLQRISRLVGPRIEPQAALVFGTLGLGVAFVLDFGGLGVSAVPVPLVIHRISMAFALGLIAAGAAKIDEQGAGLLVVGILGWIIGLVMPLAGYL